MDFKPGETGVANITYSFHTTPDIDIDKEVERIKKGNTDLPRRTTWVTPADNQVKRDEYESRYQLFKKMRDAGKSSSEIASAIGVSTVTLSSQRYRARYLKENA